MKFTAAERLAMEARATAERDQRLTQLRENPEFSRGGFPLVSNPKTTRASHVDVGNGKPRCTECGVVIFGDEASLPNLCRLTKDERHVYPNGEKAFRSPSQRAVAELIGENPWD